jgi:membrane-associated phospholipid phosphatase
VATRTQALYLAQRDHLLAHPHAPDAFAQVSAFASLHVAVTTAITLLASYLGFVRVARVMWVFLALTCVATVYLGWHFVVDDIAGLVIGWAAVRLGIRSTAAQRLTTRHRDHEGSTLGILVEPDVSTEGAHYPARDAQP